MRRARRIPGYFPVHSLSDYESPVFMRVSPAFFSRGKKFPVLFPEEGICCLQLHLEAWRTGRRLQGHGEIDGLAI